MTIGTYLAGGLIGGSLLALGSAHPLPWLGWLGVLLGAIAPHVVNHGRAPSITHSLSAFVASSLCWYGIAWPSGARVQSFAAGWSAGYLSHLFLDAMTVRGVALFWPSPVVAVLPKPERLRIEPRTPAERRLRWLLLVIAALLVPLQATGLRSTLHRLLQTPQAAEEDYIRFTGEGYRVWVSFRGFFTASQRPASGTWEAIHAPNANTLFLLDPSGHVHQLGTHPTDTIRCSRARAIRGEPIEVTIREVILRHQPLGILLNEIPSDAQVFLTGSAYLEEPVALRYSQEEAATITLTDRRLDFHHAPITELHRQRLTTIEVLRAHLLIRTLRSPRDG